MAKPEDNDPQKIDPRLESILGAIPSEYGDAPSTPPGFAVAGASGAPPPPVRTATSPLGAASDGQRDDSADISLDSMSAAATPLPPPATPVPVANRSSDVPAPGLAEHAAASLSTTAADPVEGAAPAEEILPPSSGNGMDIDTTANEVGFGATASDDAPMAVAEGADEVALDVAVEDAETTPTPVTGPPVTPAPTSLPHVVSAGHSAVPAPVLHNGSAPNATAVPRPVPIVGAGPAVVRPGTPLSVPQPPGRGGSGPVSVSLLGSTPHHVSPARHSGAVTVAAGAPVPVPVPPLTSGPVVVSTTQVSGAVLPAGAGAAHASGPVPPAPPAAQRAPGVAGAPSSGALPVRTNTPVQVPVPPAPSGAGSVRANTPGQVPVPPAPSGAGSVRAGAPVQDPAAPPASDAGLVSGIVAAEVTPPPVPSGRIIGARPPALPPGASGPVSAPVPPPAAAVEPRRGTPPVGVLVGSAVEKTPPPVSDGQVSESRPQRVPVEEQVTPPPVPQTRRAAPDDELTPPLEPVSAAAAPAAAPAPGAQPAAEQQQGDEVAFEELEIVDAPATGSSLHGGSEAAVAATPPPMPARVPAPPPPPQSAPPPPQSAATPARSAIAVPALPALPEPLSQRPRRHKRSKPWFEEVFDEDYLRTLPFMTAEQTVREVTFIEESLALKPGSTVLDVGCGYGRHAIELVQRGLDVTGLDLSLPLLIRAADESQRRSMSVNYVHADMREMAFEGRFDAAYCMLTTFGYFDEDSNLKVAQGIARALKPGGRFLLDTVNRDYIVGDLPTRIWWEGDGCVVLEEVDFNFHTSRLVTRRSVVFEDGRQLEQEISIRCYSLHELGKLLRHAGFRVLDVSGSLATRGRFFGSTSRNIIILAEKRVD